MQPARAFDVVIIGAGMAGACLAAQLPRDLRVVMLEAEEAPGYHSTGRSAAVFSKTYGNATIRALTRASEAFFAAPSAGFSEHALLSPRGVLFVARHDQLALLEKLGHELATAARRLSGDEACALAPLLRRDYVAEALLEDDAADLDVNALHTGYLRQARANDVELICNAGVTVIARHGESWLVEAGAETFQASILVNAAGAWADHVAALAGVRERGVTPKRRSMVIVDGAEIDRPEAPFVVDVEEQFYFKPEAGGVLVSPADETDCPATDVAPDDFDIAVAIDRLETAAHVQVRRIRNKWAGLRNFVADRTPLIGFDSAAPGFFWLAGQGGYGIQIAPAQGALAASLITGRGLPAQIEAHGVTLNALSPNRAALRHADYLQQGNLPT